jgi:hydroxyacylglutathione hydrolase
MLSTTSASMSTLTRIVEFIPMKKLLIAPIVLALFQTVSYAQDPPTEIAGKEVFRNDDVVFRQIDGHTWVGTGHLLSNESIYLVEGSTKAVLIDAGQKIAGLDKVVASLTKKPVMLVATHAHPDHTGAAINDFPELWIAPGDTASRFVKDYKGALKELQDGQVIDLGGRTLDVVFTPAHTPGSTTFIDKKAGYGFSGDSFGSGNLLLTAPFSTLLATCQKMSAVMEKNGIKQLYPGHFFGKNLETKQRVDDMITISKDVIAGKMKGQPGGMMGLQMFVDAYGVKIHYNERSVK